MMQFIQNINAYVEEQATYGSDSVVLNFDETNKRVTLRLVDVYNNPIAGAPYLIDETFIGATAFNDGLAFYEQIAADLAEGDVVRHYDSKAVTIRDAWNNDANRYPSF